jgi:hypothetical protein
MATSEVSVALGNDSSIVVAIASEHGQSAAPVGEATVDQRGLVERARMKHDAAPRGAASPVPREKRNARENPDH